MITEHIKIALQKNNVQYTLDEDSFNFRHPLCPKFVDCLITWEETRKQIQFVADYEIKMPRTLGEDEFASILNDLNYDSSWGNLETDRHGLLVYRLSTFLPDGRDAARERRSYPASSRWALGGRNRSQPGISLILIPVMVPPFDLCIDTFPRYNVKSRYDIPPRRICTGRADPDMSFCSGGATIFPASLRRVFFRKASQDTRPDRRFPLRT